MVVRKYPCAVRTGVSYTVCGPEPVARCIRIRLQGFLLLTPPPPSFFHAQSWNCTDCAPLGITCVYTPDGRLGIGSRVVAGLFMQQVAVLSLAMHCECVAAAAVAPEFVRACVVFVSCQETGGGCTRACTRSVIGTPVRGIPPLLIIALPPCHTRSQLVIPVVCESE